MENIFKICLDEKYRYKYIIILDNLWKKKKKIYLSDWEPVRIQHHL